MEIIFFYEILRIKEMSFRRVYESIHRILFHFPDPLRWWNVKNIFCHTVAIHTPFPDERHTHKSVLILSGTRIYEMVVRFSVDIPLASVSSGSGNGTILERKIRLDFERKRILDSDGPRGVGLVHSMCGDIAPGIDEEIIISEQEKYFWSLVYGISFCYAAEVEKLIFSYGNLILSYYDLWKIGIDQGVCFFKFSVFKRVAVSEIGNIDERIEQSLSLFEFFFRETYEFYESVRHG